MNNTKINNNWLQAIVNKPASAAMEYLATLLPSDTLALNSEIDTNSLNAYLSRTDKLNISQLYEEQIDQLWNNIQQVETQINSATAQLRDVTDPVITNFLQSSIEYYQSLETTLHKQLYALYQERKLCPAP